MEKNLIRYKINNWKNYLSRSVKIYTILDRFGKKIRYNRLEVKSTYTVVSRCISHDTSHEQGIRVECKSHVSRREISIQSGGTRASCKHGREKNMPTINHRLRVHVFFAFLRRDYRFSLHSLDRIDTFKIKRFFLILFIYYERFLSKRNGKKILALKSLCVVSKM